MGNENGQRKDSKGTYNESPNERVYAYAIDEVGMSSKYPFQ